MGNVISEFGRLVLGVGRDIQCTVMPDYTSVDPGIIVQYTGATDANYINGYFYKCTNNGWELTDVQDVSDKVNKVAGATTDDLASLTATGDLADSGKKLGDLVLKADVKDVLNSTSTTDPLSAKQGKILADNLAANEESGAKNLAILDLGAIMPINTGGTWSGNVYTHRTVNFTVTDNGVSVSGTASGGAAFIDIPLSTLTNGKEYIANGISGGADETYQIKFMNSSLVVQSVSDLYDGERTFEKNSTNHNVEIYRIRVASGANVTTDIYPMIRDARVIDPTFTPYAETNLQLTRKTSGLSNENLLDNPWFTVNQRGQTNYPSNAYTVDRWSNNVSTAIESNTVVKTNNGVTINNGANLEVGFSQTLESVSDLSGKTLTLSAKINGTIYSNTFVYDTESAISKAVTPNVTISFIGSIKQVALSITGANTVTNLRAIKLEVGSVSTLHLDVAPDYTTELLKCQRYFFRLKANSAYTTFGFGFCTIADQLVLPINLPVAMRPISAVNYVGNLRAYILGGSNKAVSAITLAASQVENMKLVFFTATGLTAGDICYLISENDSSAYIDLSADL